MAQLKQLLSGYCALAGRYDELLAAPGQARAHWAAFIEAIAARDVPQIDDTLSMMEREIRDNGITYNVYADPRGSDRLWQVDPLPLLLPADEWQAIESGVAQRAELLNRVLADIYGKQDLMRSGAVPPAVIFGHSGFLHAAQAIRPNGGVHLFHYAADLARAPDGKWWVAADRTQAPSGAGYALENRLIVSRVFPEVFRDLNVEHLASFFATLRDSLLHLAPRGDTAPLIALLTPGPYNETYFEHTLLARYLGFTLVEGSDLTVRDGHVWMKTVDGLRRVHAILRRQDDDYCDPLELRSDSALGVPGLTDCARRGTVFLANGLGSGVLESGALLGYLPRLSERLLGQELLLPSVATWWLGEPAALDDAWEQLDRILIKPLERSAQEPAVFGHALSGQARDALRRRVALRPQRYVAQQLVHVSQAPALEHAPLDRLGARTLGLRIFAVATPQGYRVMPGGLTRIAADGNSYSITMQRGGRSKDTWVLSDAPVNTSFSLLSRTITPGDMAAQRANLPSRSAENLFWFGRYAERCDSTARLLRVAISQSLGRDDAPDAPSVFSARAGLPVLELAYLQGLLSARDQGPDALLHAATDPGSGLAAQFQQLARVAYSLRDRMSLDNWRTLNRMHADALFAHAGDSTPQVGSVLAGLDRIILTMMTLSGFVLDGMTRSLGWRFLSLGRRIERLTHVCAALQVATGAGRTHGLDWLLELADSTVTYRSRYLVGPQWLAVLDLLVCDQDNPRSVAFQVKGLREYVAKLEATHGRFAGDLLAPVQAALDALRPADLNPQSPALALLLDQAQRAGYRAADELTLKFFSHAATRSMLSLVA
ncbi:MAG: circularly permuted type 2 ATP-grasp protein [Burkholderiaceae bacterium]